MPCYVKPTQAFEHFGLKAMAQIISRKSTPHKHLFFVPRPVTMIFFIYPALNHSLFNSAPDSGPETTLSTAQNGCESVQVDSSTGEINYEMSPCPEWTPDTRVPAFCCGTEKGEKTCCEWSTYIVNRVGFGRTSVG